MGHSEVMQGASKFVATVVEAAVPHITLLF